MKNLFKWVVLFEYCLLLFFAIPAYCEEFIPSNGFNINEKDNNPLRDSECSMLITQITIIQPEYYYSDPTFGTWYRKASTTYLSNFVYDNQKRIISYDYIDEYNNDKGTITYQYKTASIVRTDTDVHILTYNLTNGLVSSIPYTYGSDKYSYTNDNLTTWVESGGGSSTRISYLWENGNPVREKCGSTYNNYSYCDLSCKIGFLQQLFDDYSGIQVELMGGSCFDPFLHQLGFFGNIPKNLVIESDYHKWKMSYELNNKGYPIKITAENNRTTAEMSLEWIEAESSNLNEIHSNSKLEIIGRFDINGKPVNENYNGIMIVRFSDGSAKKILNTSH